MFRELDLMLRLIARPESDGMLFAIQALADYQSYFCFV